MKGIVREAVLSQSGKSYRVKVGSETYLGKLDSKLNEMVGRPIDFLTEATEYKGKVYNWITSWGPDTSPPPPLVAQPGQFSSNGRENRYWLPFVSNQVAHAIAAGNIKQPGEMMAWAKAAYTAVTNLEGPEF